MSDFSDPVPKLSQLKPNQRNVKQLSQNPGDENGGSIRPICDAMTVSS